LNDLSQVQGIVDSLAKSGIVTSFAYGPSVDMENVWTVQCMTKQFQEFDKPFQANSLPHAAAIAKLECELRGWS
jgi:hypothetical protein